MAILDNELKQADGMCSMQNVFAEYSIGVWACVYVCVHLCLFLCVQVG